MSSIAEMFPGETNTSRYRGLTTSELIRYVANEGGTALERELARRLDDYHAREERLEHEKEQLEDKLGEAEDSRHEAWGRVGELRDENARLNDRIAELNYLDRQQEEA
jgi:chromosome segregation ATPase